MFDEYKLYNYAFCKYYIFLINTGPWIYYGT